MSAAVATRSQQQNPSLTATGSTNRMGAKSPVDRKKTIVKTEDAANRQSSLSSSQATGKTTSPRLDPASTVKQQPGSSTDAADTTNVETSQPLAPPPRPAQHNPSATPDYFSGVHNGSHFSLEPNPFEQSFGNPSAETPGKSLLPPVASLTSPASLLRDGASSAGFNWPNSLRSGPLSPAMLTGPTGSSDYFGDGHLRGGFPTPNESSLRTGLTPGGGGSMFPAPSPSSQAILQQMASAGATPGTLEFHRTAINAAAARKSDASFVGQEPIAVSEGQGQAMAATEANNKGQKQQIAQSNTDPFGQHDANDAANGLFLLAQARSGPQDQNQYAAGVQQNPAVPAAPNGQSQNTSPNMAKPAARIASGSLGGSISGSARAVSEGSGEFSESGGSEETKPNTRAKGKKGGSNAKTNQTANGRRKAEETPTKAPASKKAKGNSGTAMPDFNADSDEEMDMNKEMLNENGKKMTDEEKRKNFLERNRVAALKCRQRKKQWLANLQTKVEIFSSENDALSAQVTQLREEIVNLKTLLLAHKDCPVSQAQGLGGMPMNAMGNEFSHHANPYGMAMPNGGQVMAGQGMQRR